MGIKISKGAIVPAKQNITIEWDGDVTDLYSETFHGITMYLMSDVLKLGHIEALRGATIYLSDGNRVSIDDGALSAMYANAEKLNGGIVAAGNDYIHIAFVYGKHHSDQSTLIGPCVWFRKDGDIYVQKLVLPKADVMHTFGKTVREECWCKDYHFEGGSDFHYHDFLDAKDQPRRLTLGRTYRVTMDGETYELVAKGNTLTTYAGKASFWIYSKPGEMLSLSATKGKHTVSITEIIETGTSVADAAGSTPTSEEFNALLAALRDAGIIAN